MEITEPEIRFERHYVKGGEHDCWLWTGATSVRGYGMFTLAHHHTMLAHRYAFQIANDGVLVPKAKVLQTCRNKRCVNPSHLVQKKKPRKKREWVSMQSVEHMLVMRSQNVPTQRIAVAYKISADTVLRYFRLYDAMKEQEEKA